ncbi:hypothetical protein Xazr_03700 [Xanthomonas campestris pv. azadirachtae]|nr:hypothetical protein Xazr_03700 [Xanthomonas campestris pv. azadirachtae]
MLSSGSANHRGRQSAGGVRNRGGAIPDEIACTSSTHLVRARYVSASSRRLLCTAARTSAGKTWHALDAGLLRAIEERTSAIGSI